MQNEYITIAVARENKPDFVSSMIMFFMRTNYSHVLMCKDRVIYHSVGKGVEAVPYGAFMKDHTLPITRLVKLTCTLDQLGDYLDAHIGKEYSESQYIGFIFPFLKPFFRNRKKKTICSEFVARLLNNCCGYEFKDCDFLSPKNVIEAL